MSKRSFRIASGIVVATFVVGAYALWHFYKEYDEYMDKPHNGSSDEIVVEIKRGMSFPAIAKELARAEVIEHPFWFRLHGMQAGVTTKVRSGKYVLRGDMTPNEVLEKLLAGVKEVTARVTVPEGLHMLEVFKLFEEAGVASATELEGLARDPEFLAENAIQGETIEGYLYPDTYFFQAPSSPKLVLRTLLKQHRIVWDRLSRKHAESMRKLQEDLGWSQRDFLIMASIVEKEAVSAKERPTIAQVFINRLASPKFVPHRLDTDPTIRYGCTVPLQKSAACRDWDITDRLHRKQLDDTDNPYNTYQHEGLPPGPICSPGSSAMAAAMNPDGSKYFYFVAMDPRTHAFAKTKAEHDRNVRKYILGQ